MTDSSSPTDKAHLPTDAPTTADLVGRLAQERDAQEREQLTQQAAQRELPTFVLAIEQSEARYTIPPRLLPIAHVDYEKLRVILSEKWQLSPDPEYTKLGGILASMPRDQLGQVPESELMRRLLKSSRPEIGFELGRYPLSDFEFVPVLGVQITRESVLVSVAGISQVAEYLVTEMVQAIWASAGVMRPWSDIEPEVQARGYATKTKVDLGAATEQLLNPKLIDFFNNEVLAGAQFASHMGLYLARHDNKPPPQAVTTYALDDLQLKFATFDPATGTTTNSKITISVTSLADYQSGIVSVASELPYDVHIQCLEQLIASVLS
jgi:hypothetical protein